MSESLESQQTPELHSAELLQIIDNLPIEAGEEFSFNGQDFYLCTLNEEEARSSGDAWYAASTYIVGWDIYILETLPPEERRRKFFHEILEASITRSMPTEKAHKIALAEEERVFGKRK